MSTETEPAAQEITAAEPGATPEEQPLGTPGLAALKSEREAKAAAEKRAAEAEARVKEFEDREKTEAQKQQEALEKAQKELAELTVAKTRAEIAAATGVPVELLTGSTADDIQASADRLKAWRGQQPAAGEPQRFVIPGEGGQPSIPLNGDGLEAALKKALGIS